MNSESLFLKLKGHPLAFLSLLIFLIYIAMALLAHFELIALNYAATDLDLSYQPPSSQHWFGTDFLGRDIYARVIHGAKVAVTIGFFAASLATLIGLILGALAGYFGGRIDDFVVWLYSTLESIPSILLLSAFAFSLGAGVFNLFLALGITGWVKMCRLTRAEFLKHKNLEYVAAAQALGASHLRRIFHIYPNVFHLGLIQFSLSFVYAIKYEVILSYLGLGVEPGVPSWGAMINDAKVELTRGVWWNLAATTTFMFFLILSINLLADSLRNFLDPKSISSKIET